MQALSLNQFAWVKLDKEKDGDGYYTIKINTCYEKWFEICIFNERGMVVTCLCNHHQEVLTEISVGNIDKALIEATKYRDLVLKNVITEYL